MPDSRHHPDCPRCKGKGFFLRREGHGFYRDGSFGHNDWDDCDCDPFMTQKQLQNRLWQHKAAGGEAAGDSC